jgi:hypothetical protein
LLLDRLKFDDCSEGFVVFDCFHTVEYVEGAEYGDIFLFELGSFASIKYGKFAHCSRAYCYFSEVELIFVDAEYLADGSGGDLKEVDFS